MFNTKMVLSSLFKMIENVFKIYDNLLTPDPTIHTHEREIEGMIIIHIHAKCITISGLYREVGRGCRMIQYNLQELYIYIYILKLLHPD